MERPTFSPFWHRVRSMTPRLRSHVQVTRQFYRGRRWFVAHDPTSNHFYRLSPVGYDLVGLLDGRRTVEEAWQIALSKFGDNAPTQPEVIELLGQLYNSNLLQVDATPETEQLLRRGQQRVQKRLAQRALSIMYFKLRLINPDPLLKVVEPIMRPVLNRWGLLVWAGFVIYVLSRLLPEWDRLVAQASSLTNPANWGWVLVVFVLLKLWHELGHGVVCRRLGGQVPEAGVMLLVLLPSPYGDASSAWSFASRWPRLAVGAGGMLFELFAAGVAGLVWLSVDAGSLASELSFYALFSASVATVLFNANPLMKFDGYYMLSDLLEVPNLQQRSQQLVRNFFLRTVYRVPNVKPVTDLAGERAILFIYSWASLAFRIFVFLSITLWLIGTWFGVGFVLAIWSAAAWFLMPLGMLVHFLASSPKLAERRGRAIALTILMIGAGAAVIGLVPLPDWRRATGIVDAEQRSGLFAGTDGFVRAVHARPGERIAKGEPILELENPELDARLAQTRAEIAEFEAQLRMNRAQGDVASQRVVEGQLAVGRATLAELERQATELIVRSPRDGVVASGDPFSSLGRFVRRGEPVCIVLEPREATIHAVVDQTEGTWLFAKASQHGAAVGVGGAAGVVGEAYRIEMRLASDVQRVLVGRVERVVPAGQAVLPHPSLGFMGGGRAEIDTQADPGGRIAKTERFSVFITPEDGEALRGVLPGQRVFLRFTLAEGRSLGWQVLDRLRKAVQGRVNL